MVMEDGLQAGLGSTARRDRFGAGGEVLPLVRRPSAADAAGALGAVGHRAVFVGQDEIGQGLSGDRGQRASDLDGGCNPAMRAACDGSLSATGTKAPSMTSPRRDNSPRNAGGSVGM